MYMYMYIILYIYHWVDFLSFPIARNSLLKGVVPFVYHEYSLFSLLQLVQQYNTFMFQYTFRVNIPLKVNFFSDNESSNIDPFPEM